MYTSRTRSPYFFRTCRIEGSARRQNGHSKSEYSTIVTAALSPPRCGCPPAASLSCELELFVGFEAELSLDDGTRTQSSWASMTLALFGPAIAATGVNIPAPMLPATK